MSSDTLRRNGSRRISRQSSTPSMCRRPPLKLIQQQRTFVACVPLDWVALLVLRLDHFMARNYSSLVANGLGKVALRSQCQRH